MRSSGSEELQIDTDSVEDHNEHFALNLSFLAKTNRFLQVNEIPSLLWGFNPLPVRSQVLGRFLVLDDAAHNPR